MKFYLKIIALMMFVAVPVVYNSCGSTHQGSFNSVSSFSSADSCIPLLAQGSKPIWDYLQPKCATCHYQGTSSAPLGYYFADSIFPSALVGFANIVKVDANKIYNKAYDPAHFGGAGPSLMATMEPLKANFMTSSANYKDCLAQAAQGPGGGPPPTSFDPNVLTIEKTVPANPTAPITLTWNLTSELAGGASLNGAQFQITVQSPTAGIYHLSAPSARGTTVSAITVRNIRVLINGVLVGVSDGGGTWTSLNNLASSARLHPLSQGTSVMVLAVDTTRSNQLSFGFGAIEENTSYPDFNPTTYTRLTSTNTAIPAAERVFRTKCMSCHNGAGGAGGVGLDPASLGLLKINAHVIPYVPSSSSVFSLMNLPNGTAGIMPPGGRATNEEIRWVRDWILDGAPL